MVGNIMYSKSHERGKKINWARYYKETKREKDIGIQKLSEDKGERCTKKPRQNGHVQTRNKQGLL
jgi:hypothetical protein